MTPAHLNRERFDERAEAFDEVTLKITQIHFFRDNVRPLTRNLPRLSRQSEVLENGHSWFAQRHRPSPYRVPEYHVLNPFEALLL